MRGAWSRSPVPRSLTLGAVPGSSRASFRSCGPPVVSNIVIANHYHLQAGILGSEPEGDRNESGESRICRSVEGGTQRPERTDRPASSIERAGSAAAPRGEQLRADENYIQEERLTSPVEFHADKNRRKIPDEYAPASAFRNSRKDSCASASAVSETVRTTAHRTSCSKHTCASAAPSISTASASGNAVRSAFTSS